MDDYEDEDTLEAQDPSLSGTLGQLSGALTEMTNPSTTPEAQKYARQILDQYSKGMPEEGELMGQMETNAESTRALLRSARERIANRKYDKRQMWLAAANALGNPTKTGAIGETAGYLAKNIGIEREKQHKFEYDQEDDLTKFDQAISGVDDSMLNRRLQLLLAKQKDQAGLAKTALTTLGKRTAGIGNGTKGEDALDKAYGKDLLEFVQGGSAVAAKSIEELKLSLGQLRSGKDNLTGPVVGTLASIPVVGKAIQDVVNPEASNVREMVESTIQSSLRPILGSQFTEKEGERLIARVYNQRLGEEVNAQRVERLLQQVERAYQNKLKAAEYWSQHGTLRGFKGQLQWTMADFAPDHTWPGGAKHDKPEADDGAAVDVLTEDDLDDDAAPRPANVRPGKPERGGSGGIQAPILQLEDLPEVPTGRAKPPRKAHRMRLPWELFGGKEEKYAEGGEVDGEREVFPMPDGTMIEAPAGSDPAEIEARYMATQQTDEGAGLDPETTTHLAEGALSGGLGYLATKYGTRAAMGATNVLPGRSINKGEKRVLGLMDTMDIQPDFLANRLRELQKRNVPAMMLDVAGPEVRGLGEASLMPRASETAPFIDELRNRQRGTRERVSDQVNDALAPDPFTAHYDDLKKRRKDTADKNYRVAYDAHPKVPSSIVAPFLKSPSFDKAWKAAEKGWKDRPTSKGKLPYKVDATGTTYDYPLEFLDDVKQRFDDLIAEAKTNGAKKKVGDLTGVQQQFRDALDNATGAAKSPYKSARGAFEEDSKLLEQMDFGKDEFLKMSPDDAAKHVAGLSFDQKDALRTGVAESLFRSLKGPYTDTNPAQKLAGSPDAMARMETLFDKPKDFEIFKAALEAEQSMYDETRGTLNKGKSARGHYEPPPNVIASKLKNAPAFGVFSPTYWALKNLRKESKIDEKEADQVLRVLRTKDPALIEKNLGRKFRRGEKRRKIAGKAGLVGAALGAAAPFLTDDEDDEPIEKKRGGPIRRKPGLAGLKEKYGA